MAKKKEKQGKADLKKEIKKQEKTLKKHKEVIKSYKKLEKLILQRNYNNCYN